MAYPCDLPSNTGNTDILRAIYAKMDSSSQSSKIEKKLDILIDKVEIVNNNIIQNTEAIKDVSIDIKLDGGQISDAIDNLTTEVKRGFDNTTHAIDNIGKKIKPKPHPIPPGPIPPCPIPPGPIPPCPIPPEPQPCYHNHYNSLSSNYCAEYYGPNNPEYYHNEYPSDGPQPIQDCCLEYVKDTYYRLIYDL